MKSLQERNETFSFGVETKPKKRKPSLKSIVPPNKWDGAEFTSFGHFYQVKNSFDTFNLSQNEMAMIDRYRNMERLPEIQPAIDDIINEMIILHEKEEPIKLLLEDSDIPKNIQNILHEEWSHVMKLYNVKERAFDIAKRWYVDSKIYYYLLTDSNNLSNGVQEVRFIDPRKIKKVIAPKDPKQLKQNVDNFATLYPDFEEYFIFNQKNVNNFEGGLRIPIDCIAYAHSGIYDQRTGTIVSHLHQAIKPLNVLRMLEDAFIIYKITRAPERRIFYIDIANLPLGLGEKYIASTVQRYKNQILFDQSTGEINNDKLFMTMTQDFFFPQREGKATNVQTLPGGEKDFTNMTHVDYHMKKLYKALNIPISRVEEGAPFNVGRTSEISRDEVKFNKFIKRLRISFLPLFTQTLKFHCALKNKIAKDEFEEILPSIKFDFVEDNMYTELKDQELYRNRIEILQMISQFSTVENPYFSRKWIYKNILRMSDEEIKDMKKEIEAEIKSGEIKSTMIEEPTDSETPKSKVNNNKKL